MPDHTSWKDLPEWKAKNDPGNIFGFNFGAFGMLDRKTGLFKSWTNKHLVELLKHSGVNVHILDRKQGFQFNYRDAVDYQETGWPLLYDDMKGIWQKPVRYEAVVPANYLRGGLVGLQPSDINRIPEEFWWTVGESSKAPPRNSRGFIESKEVRKEFR